MFINLQPQPQARVKLPMHVATEHKC